MRRSLLAWSLVAGLAGCRSAGGPPVRPSTEPPPDFVQSLVGQRRILMHAKGETRIQVAPGASAGSAACAAAVEVTRAAWTGGVLRLDLEHLGRPRLAPSPAAATCGPPAAYVVTASGLAGGDGAEGVEKALAGRLVTVEAFLAASGVAFDRRPVDAPGVSAMLDAPGTTAEERSLGRKVKTWSKPLVTVPAELALGDKKRRLESEVEFVGVVGPDGRLHQPSVTTRLADAHRERVLQTLSLWRFEPAQTADGPVASRVSLRTSLRIY
ncbi:MAG: hypothetical protein ABW221_12265 [Vicinamibacteria bacterium]